MFVRYISTTAGTCRLLARRFSNSSTPHKGFPLTGPAWSVGSLLEESRGISYHPVLKVDLDPEPELEQHDIEHLHNLCGLTMPDPLKNPEELEQITTEINHLRNFLGHIHVVTRSGDLDSIEPLVRIAEPVQFTANKFNGGLKFADDPGACVGRKSLETAEKKSDSFFIVED
ncbi:hypothetical protein IW136_003360 [Coemansia sp. RSA 678]|nr:hypothetical protein IW136_003360 [Coemansia sp. RSA 678]